jgi:hypothetical protein
MIVLVRPFSHFDSEYGVMVIESERKVKIGCHQVLLFSPFLHHCNCELCKVMLIQSKVGTFEDAFLLP